MNLQYIYTASQEATEYSGSRFHIRPTVKLFPLQHNCFQMLANPQWAHIFLIDFFWIQHFYQEQLRQHNKILNEDRSRNSKFSNQKKRNLAAEINPTVCSSSQLHTYLHILMLLPPFELMHCEIKCLMKIAIESALLLRDCGVQQLVDVMAAENCLSPFSLIFDQSEFNFSQLRRQLLS